MNNRRIRIIDQQRLDNAITAVRLLPIDGTKEVIIRGFKRNRSASQQALQWMWMTDISDATGETKEEVHKRCKGSFLKPILTRDEPEFAYMIATLRELYRAGEEERSRYLLKFIVRESSTTKLDVSQMAEYLTCVERTHTSNGIVLRYPDDYKYSMGGKK